MKLGLGTGSTAAKFVDLLGAVRALDDVSSAVMRCARADSHSLGATVDFDNAHGTVANIALTSTDGSPLPERLQTCARAALQRATFRAPENVNGITRVARMWRVR